MTNAQIGLIVYSFMMVYNIVVTVLLIKDQSYLAAGLQSIPILITASSIYIVYEIYKKIVAKKEQQSDQATDNEDDLEGSDNEDDLEGSHASSAPSLRKDQDVDYNQVIINPMIRFPD